MKGSGLAKSEQRVPQPLRFEKGVVTLHIHVQPGASRTEWAGWYGAEALKLRLAAPPVDGKANRACRDFVAKSLGVPSRQVTIVWGEKSRSKTVVVQEVPMERWERFRNRWEIE